MKLGTAMTVVTAFTAIAAAFALPFLEKPQSAQNQPKAATSVAMPPPAIK